MAQTSQNLLLEAYAKEAGPRLQARLEPVDLPYKFTLMHSAERPRFVHFITTGMSSLVNLMEEGHEVEVAITAREGFAEAIHLLGPEPSPRECMMQIPGTGLRMPFRAFEEMFQEDEQLRRLVLRLVQVQGLAAAQLVACNGQHEAEERLARWLLLVSERISESVLPLTQELLGQMLGARRSTVTIAASNLQRAGMIEYCRGKIRIVNRERLAETACECYGVIHKLYDNLYKA